MLLDVKQILLVLLTTFSYLLHCAFGRIHSEFTVSMVNHNQLNMYLTRRGLILSQYACLWLDRTPLLCSSSELQQRAGPTAYLCTTVCLNATKSIIMVDLHAQTTTTKKKKQREVVQVCLCKSQIVGVALVRERAI